MFRALWLGGSWSNGRTDELSDIDLCAFVPEGATAEAIRTIERVASEMGEFEISMPDFLVKDHWHQGFWMMRGMGHGGLIDAVCMDDPAGNEVLVVERHGTPHVLLDPEGLLAPVAMDRVAHQRLVDDRLARLRGFFPLVGSLVLKEVERGCVASSAAWHARLMAELVTALRIASCPDRFDFGARYLADDLPDAVREEYESLVLPASLEEIRVNVGRAMDLFNRALARIDGG